MAGTDKFYIRVNGVGGHGGTPHLVKDTVLAASAVVMNLQPLISRETDPTEGGIIGVTLINSGKLLCVSANGHLEPLLVDVNRDHRIDGRDVPKLIPALLDVSVSTQGLLNAKYCIVGCWGTGPQPLPYIQLPHVYNVHDKLVCLTGPGSPNVHAEYVELQGTVNSFTTSGLDHLKSRIIQVLCVA